MEYPEVRGTDSWGSGRYGASRGSRRHNGEDFVCSKGEEIRAFSSGTVTKIGYAYSDDLSFRYIELDCVEWFCRYFYVIPTECIEVGKVIHAYEVLGLSKDLTKRYQGITQHYHFEVFKNHEYGKPRGYIHPRQYIEGLS